MSHTTQATAPAPSSRPEPRPSALQRLGGLGRLVLVERPVLLALGILLVLAYYGQYVGYFTVD